MHTIVVTETDEQLRHALQDLLSVLDAHGLPDHGAHHLLRVGALADAGELAVRATKGIPAVASLRFEVSVLTAVHYTRPRHQA